MSDPEHSATAVDAVTPLTSTGPPLFAPVLILAIKTYLVALAKLRFDPCRREKTGVPFEFIEQNLVVDEGISMKTILIAPAVLVALIAGYPLFASGGGGGGGSSSFPSESAPQYDPAVEYRNGVTALEAKDFAKAKRAFDRVISVSPKDANSQYLAGVSRTGLNDWKGGRRFFEKAVKLDPGMIRAHQQLGVTYAKLGEKALAGAVLATLQARAGTCAGSCAQSAELKTAVDSVSAAVSATPVAHLNSKQSLMFATTADGDNAYLGAVSLINEGRYDAAINALNIALASFGPHPDLLTYLGFANRKLKRFDVAEDYYRQALAVAPAHRGATEYYGELMVERGDFAAASKMLAQLDLQCRFGCAEAEELRRWISVGHSPHS